MLVSPRVGPVPMVQAALPAGARAGLGPQPGDVLWLRLAGAPGGERQLLGQDGRPLRLLGAASMPPELARLPAGTPLAWTVLGTTPQLSLGLRPLSKPAAAEPAAPPAAPAEPDPARGEAGTTLQPDAQVLRLQHRFSSEATSLAMRWRQRVLAGVATPPDRRGPWRQEAVAGRWPWSLLALCPESPPSPAPADAPLPTLADAARWQLELTEGAQRLGLLLVEPDMLIASPPPHDNEPGSGRAPLMRALALRLLLTLPGLGLVVLQLQFTRGGTGLALRLAAAHAEALATLRHGLPAMASALARLDLALQHCQLDLQGPGLRPWSPAPRLLQAERLPPLLFRAATELVLCLWQATGVVQPAAAARQAPAAQPKEPTMLTSRCSGISLYDSTCSPGAKSRA